MSPQRNTKARAAALAIRAADQRARTPAVADFWRWRKPTRYSPHQGAREMARRRRQMLRAKIKGT
jgi:hypothetical protein